MWVTYKLFYQTSLDYVLLQNGDDPKWLIATKSAVYLIVGVGMVRFVVYTVESTIHAQGQ